MQEFQQSQNCRTFKEHFLGAPRLQSFGLVD